MCINADERPAGILLYSCSSCKYRLHRWMRCSEATCIRDTMDFTLGVQSINTVSAEKALYNSDRTIADWTHSPAYEVFAYP